MQYGYAQCQVGRPPDDADGGKRKVRQRENAVVHGEALRSYGLLLNGLKRPDLTVITVKKQFQFYEFLSDQFSRHVANHA